MRALKLKELRFPVVIIGGGLSGMCAALACARHGAETALIHGRHVFGGNASSEIRMHVCGASENGKKSDYEEGGILHEILLDNKAVNDYYNYSVWDRVLYEKMKFQKNLTCLMNTVMEECQVIDGHIDSILCYQMTTETYYRIHADIFIDCTGNGTLGYMAGADYHEGSEARSEYQEPDAPEQADKNRMGNTLLFKAVERDHPITFKKPAFAPSFSEIDLLYRPHSAIHQRVEGESEDYYRMTSYSASSLDYGYWWCELSGRSDSIIDDYETIRDELVAAVYGIWDHLKNVGDHGAANYDLEWVGMLPGMRESRRLIGDYVLTENDVLSQRIFDDAIAYGGWAIDMHTAHGLYDMDKRPSKCIAFQGAYTIPYRCLYSRNINNLMMAGRDISASKLAFASSRVMGTCALVGQAAGTAAASCVERGIMPRELLPYIRTLQLMIQRDDGFIPGIPFIDLDDLARKAVVSATSEQKGYEAANVINGMTRSFGEETNLWCSKGLDQAKLSLRLPTSAMINHIQLTFDSNFRYPIKITLSQKRQAQQRIGVPEELVRDCDVYLQKNGKTVRKLELRENHQRLVNLCFEPTQADEVVIHVTSTNGAQDARIFEVGLYNRD